MSNFPYHRILVTGGAGFIGSHLVEALLRNRVQLVVVLDNLSAGSLTNIEPYMKFQNFLFIQEDITNFNSLDKLFKQLKFDLIFHQAASKKNICLDDPVRDLEVNTKGTLNLLLLATKYKVKRFIHASTGSVYGEPVVLPQDEDHPLNPVSYYGVSKLAGEKYVTLFTSLGSTVLRYFHVYGPRQADGDSTGGVIAIFIKRMLEGKPLIVFGDGSQIRSFTYVKDVVQANLKCACNPQTIGKVYNCASGIKVRLSEVIKLLASIMKIDPSIEYRGWVTGDIKYFDVDNSRLIRDIGPVFTTQLVDGLEETVQFMKVKYESQMPRM